MQQAVWLEPSQWQCINAVACLYKGGFQGSLEAKARTCYGALIKGRAAPGPGDLQEARPIRGQIGTAKEGLQERVPSRDIRGGQNGKAFEVR